MDAFLSPFFWTSGLFSLISSSFFFNSSESKHPFYLVEKYKGIFFFVYFIFYGSFSVTLWISFNNCVLIC